MAVRRAPRVATGEILGTILEFQDEYGYAPTYRDLSERLGLAVSAVGYRINQLRKEGLLASVPSPSSARTLVVSRAGLRVLDRYRNSETIQSSGQSGTSL